MSTDFKDIMSKRTDDELIKIVTIDRGDYQPLAITAAEEEIKNRKLDTAKIEQVESEIKKKKHIDDKSIRTYPFPKRIRDFKMGLEDAKKNDVIMFFLMNALIVFLVFVVLLPSNKYGELFVFRDLPETQWRLYSWVRIGLCVIPMTMALYTAWASRYKLIGLLWKLIIISSCIFSGILDTFQNEDMWNVTTELNMAVTGKHTYRPGDNFVWSLLTAPLANALFAFLVALLILYVTLGLWSKWSKKN